MEEKKLLYCCEPILTCLEDNLINGKPEHSQWYKFKLSIQGTKEEVLEFLHDRLSDTVPALL